MAAQRRVTRLKAVTRGYGLVAGLPTGSFCFMPSSLLVKATYYALVFLSLVGLDFYHNFTLFFPMYPNYFGTIHVLQPAVKRNSKYKNRKLSPTSHVFYCRPGLKPAQVAGGTGEDCATFIALDWGSSDDLQLDVDRLVEQISF